MLSQLFHKQPIENIGSNSEKTAVDNRRLILKNMMSVETISRIELANNSGLSKQTLTNIIKELIELGLIVEAGIKIEGKGQPKRMLSLNPDAVFSIGIHLDQHYLKAVTINWQGKIRLIKEMTLVDWTPDHALVQIAQLVNDLILEEQPHCKIIAGYGLSYPNLIDNNQNNYRGAPEWKSWADYPVREVLTNMVDLPIFIENDATANAFGHLNSERFDSLSHFITLFIGYGLGGGIISNKLPVRGHWGNAGEIGQIISPSGYPIEGNLSVNGLKKALNDNKTGLIDPDMLIKMLKEKNEALMKWVTQAGADLNYITHILENIFDPETVILSGYLPPQLVAEIIKQAQPLQDSVSNRNQRQFDRISLGYAQMGITAKGAAMLPLLTF